MIWKRFCCPSNFLIQPHVITEAAHRRPLRRRPRQRIRDTGTADLVDTSLLAAQVRWLLIRRSFLPLTFGSAPAPSKRCTISGPFGK